MKIVDKTKNKQEEQWQLGDVLKSPYSDDIGLIVLDDDNNYCLISIGEENCGKYQIGNYYGNKHHNLNKFQESLEDSWHKVNAKLVIE